MLLTGILHLSPVPRKLAWSLALVSFTVLLLLLALTRAAILGYSHMIRESELRAELAAGSNIRAVLGNTRVAYLLPSEEPDIRRLVQVIVLLEEGNYSPAANLATSLSLVDSPEKERFLEVLDELASLRDEIATLPPETLPVGSASSTSRKTELETDLAELQQEALSLSRRLLGEVASPRVSPTFIWLYATAKRITALAGVQLPYLRARRRENPQEIIAL